MLNVGALFGEYHGQVFRYLLRRCWDRELAEDLAQQTFLKAHRSAGTYTDRGHDPKAWLFTIARNVLFDHVRATRPTTSLSLVPEHAALTADAGGDRQVDRADLERGLERLTEKQAAVLRARYLRDLSILETVSATGISEDGVKKLAARGLASLRRILEHETRRAA